jgi:superfamily II DNA or RNA helicase/HKD family nuclease
MSAPSAWIGLPKCEKDLGTMSSQLSDGLYESLLTNHLVEAIKDFGFRRTVTISGEDLDQHLLRVIAKALVEKFSTLKKVDEKISFANEILALTGTEVRVVSGADAEILLALVFKPLNGTKHLLDRPVLGLSDIGLLTNSSVGLNVGSQLRRELPSADSVYILMSFVKKAGIAHIEQQLRDLIDRGVDVRLLTTVYMGATDAEALDRLVTDLGVKVKVSYDTKTTRLHAKAWLLERNSGFSTAFVGSSNLSNPALSSGLEWNVRLSQVSSPAVVKEFKTAFEAYWNADEFHEYLPARDRETLDVALEMANPSGTKTENYFVPNLDVEPRLHQSKMLDDLEYSRSTLGLHKNLVVAATGTGKTVLAALDYKNIHGNGGSRPKLLFVAHRQEILKQALATYRAVLKDGNFGEIYVAGNKPKAWNHVFASVQSLSSFDIQNFDRDAFDVVVIDEFHHGTAPTYRRIIDHLIPQELLGLTATPERADGERVQDAFFEGRIASELRLWDAMDQALLSPFEYFGIGEDRKTVDYSKVELTGSGSYKTASLSNVLTGNDLRDFLLLREMKSKVGNFRTMKALFFCVDQKHANYVAELLKEKAGIQAVAVTDKTPDDERSSAQADLLAGKIQAIASVDVFNEGVDLPEVDTIVMLRPTESPVVFLQQLGRGLRLAKGKTNVTVLDFIGAHRGEYRFDRKLGALLGKFRGELKEQVETGFPNIPSGINVSLDAVAQQFVLESLKEQLGMGSKKLAMDAKAIGTLDLEVFLGKSGHDLIELINKSSWLKILSESGLISSALEHVDDWLAKKSYRLAHLDDLERIDRYSSFLIDGIEKWSDLSEKSKRFASMFFWNLFPDAKSVSGDAFLSIAEGIDYVRDRPLVVSEYLSVMQAAKLRMHKMTYPVIFKKAEIPVQAHAHYTRDELLGVFEWARLKGNPIRGDGTKTTRSKGHQVGVEYLKEIDTDLLIVNLVKEESKFSVSTRYKDFALTKDIFCCDSQNKDSVDTVAGVRYINQRTSRHDVVIAMREKSDGGTFMIVGLADYLDHSGNNPISLKWKLRHPLDAESFMLAAAVRTA